MALYINGNKVFNSLVIDGMLKLVYTVTVSASQHGSTPIAFTLSRTKNKITHITITGTVYAPSALTGFVATSGMIANDSLEVTQTSSYHWSYIQSFDLICDNTDGSIVYSGSLNSGSDVTANLTYDVYMVNTDSEETIWTSGDVSNPATVGTAYTFSTTLDKFEAIKLVITSPSDGANGIYSEEIWSVESINNVIADSHVITPVPICAGFYGVKERYFTIDISNTGFTVTGNGAVNESVSARPSVFAIIGIKYSNVEKIFDTGSITSLVAVNSQQTLLKPLDNFDLIQVVFSNANDGANGLVATYTFDTEVALTTGMICKAYWYKYRQMTLSFTNTTFTTLSSSANAEASGYNILVYQMYGIKL